MMRSHSTHLGIRTMDFIHNRYSGTRCGCVRDCLKIYSESHVASDPPVNSVPWRWLKLTPPLRGKHFHWSVRYPPEVPHKTFPIKKSSLECHGGLPLSPVCLSSPLRQPCSCHTFFTPDAPTLTQRLPGHGLASSTLLSGWKFNYNWLYMTKHDSKCTATFYQLLSQWWPLMVCSSVA